MSKVLTTVQDLHEALTNIVDNATLHIQSTSSVAYYTYTVSVCDINNARKVLAQLPKTLEVL